MILVAVLTFLATTAGWACLLWLAGRRVVAHLKENPAATHCVVEHVVFPILGRRKPETKEEVRDEAGP